MKPSAVKTIRRIALAGVVIMVTVVAATYLSRRWAAQQARQAVSTPLAEGVEQQAEKFTFSRSEGDKTLFAVEADRSTERAGRTTVLENVVVHIYGRSGERNDEIRTPRCEYDAGGTQKIVCPGEVTVLLRNPDASPDADAAMRLTTATLQFDPTPNVAWTDQPVRFTFPGGSGEAVGLRYQSAEPRVEFSGEVNINVTRPHEGTVELHGSSLTYNSDTRAFELAPPLRASVGDRTLVADRLRVELDDNFRTRRIEALGNARAAAPQDGRRLTMAADRAVADYGPGGSLQQLRATGHVQFEGQGGDTRQRLECREAVFHFTGAETAAVDRIVATGASALVMESPLEKRTLRAPELELRLRPADGQHLLARGRATLELVRRDGDTRTVTSDTMDLQLGSTGRLRQLAASGAVEMQVASSAPLRRFASQELRARFADDGSLTSAEQWGNFRYRDDRWQAQAGRADYQASSNSFVLTDQPAVSDASTRTTAQRIEITTDGGTLRAAGDVRSTLRAAQGFGTGEPVKLAAERLTASDRSAVYEGQARLWQGESRLAAARIEWQPDSRGLLATGNVSALFLDAAKSASGAAPVIRIVSERFTYDEPARSARFEGGVRATNDFGTLTTPLLEVSLAGGGAGSTRVESARASGGVRIEQGGVAATSEEGEYRAEPQTVVLWGGTPTLHDPARGTTTGARLTLFLADATISVDSAEGTRTITRRPLSQ